MEDITTPLIQILSMNLYIPVLIASTFTINGHDNDQISDSGFGDFELNAQFWNISMIIFV